MDKSTGESGPAGATGGAEVVRPKGVLPGIVLVSSDEGYDWLVLDGVVRDEGHSLTMSDLLRVLDIPFSVATVDEAWLEEQAGSTPLNFKDFKLTGKPEDAS